MTKYSKASDSMVSVVDAKGKEHRVTQRAFDIVYKAQGFKLATETDEDRNDDKVDLYALTHDELLKVSNDDLKAFLDVEEIEYASNAIKDDLIYLILGE